MPHHISTPKLISHPRRWLSVGGRLAALCVLVVVVTPAVADETDKPIVKVIYHPELEIYAPRKETPAVFRIIAREPGQFPEPTVFVEYTKGTTAKDVWKDEKVKYVLFISAGKPVTQQLVPADRARRHQAVSFTFSRRTQKGSEVIARGEHTFSYNVNKGKEDVNKFTKLYMVMPISQEIDRQLSLKLLKLQPASVGSNANFNGWAMQYTVPIKSDKEGPFIEVPVRNPYDLEMAMTLSGRVDLGNLQSAEVGFKAVVIPAKSAKTLRLRIDGKDAPLLKGRVLTFVTPGWSLLDPELRKFEK